MLFHLFPSPRVQLLLLLTITILLVLSIFLLDGELSSPMTSKLKKKEMHLWYIFPYKRERIAYIQQQFVAPAACQWQHWKKKDNVPTPGAHRRALGCSREGSKTSGENISTAQPSERATRAGRSWVLLLYARLQEGKSSLLKSAPIDACEIIQLGAGAHNLRS